MDRIFTFRYMWQFKDNKNVNFKIVTDTLDGLSDFEKHLCALDNVVAVAKEYLHEYDVARIGLFENLLKKDGN